MLHVEGFIGLGTLRMQLVRVVLGLIAAFALLAGLSAAAASAGPFVDDSGGAYQILAPGAEGGLEAGEFSTDQGELYSALTPKEGKVSAKTIEADFLSEKFERPASPLRTEDPKPGVEIVRDKHDIPHIFGETRSDVMFGSGWVAAKDRGILLYLGLGPAYVAALGIPGLNAFELLLGDRSFKPSAQAEAFVGNQVNVLKEEGPRGEQVISDLEAWTEGVNAYEESLPEDERIIPHVGLSQAVAGFAFIGSIFGNGGGNEVNNSNFLDNLIKKYGEEKALQIFHALRESNDPEAPTTAPSSDRFEYDTEPAGIPRGSALVEAGTVSNSARKADSALLASRRKMSNFLLVGSESAKAAKGKAKTKSSIAVMGPQLGYYYPEIVYQEDLHGPGIDAEGIVAPISPYVFIGRGRDFAWSLTSASSENVQQFMLQLCNPSGEGEITDESTGYVYDGECKEMTTFDAGKIGASGHEPAHEVYFKESVYGPVSGFAKVNGKPYAIATDRTTRGREPAGEIAFSDLDSDRVHTPEQFFEAANELETTFNMAYLDHEHIAFFSTGLLPKLAPETDPALPTFGNGEFNWRGWLSLEEHPHVVLTKGELLNWNNKPAPGWGAASENYSYGPIHRVQLFRGFNEEETEAGVVSVMGGASQEDLRALDVWPVIYKVLEGERAPSPLAEEGAKLINEWITSKHPASLYGKKGYPKAPGAAVIDAIFDPIEEAVLKPVLGESLGEFLSFAGLDNNRNSGGSSFGGGMYGQVDKDLRALLGESVSEPYTPAGWCEGSLEACRKLLWSTVQKAMEAEQANQGGEPAKKWHANAVAISFAGVGLKKGGKEYTMPWTNRSTFQQVIEFTSHQEECMTGTLAEEAEKSCG